MKTRIPADPKLTSIAMAYKNPDKTLIADLVMFKTPPVGGELFKYLTYDVAEGFTVPDTSVGRKGRVNEVSFGATELEASTKDYALEDPIPATDIEAAKSRGINIVGDSVEYIMNMISLDREVRVANLVQDASNYNPARVEALSGVDMFTDAFAKPLAVLHDALDSMFIRGNTLTFSSYIWGLFRRHPNVIKAFFPNGGGSSVTREQVIAELEIERLLVGGSFVNNARKGQEANMVRTWGNSIAIHHQDTQASNRRGMTWGMTVPRGSRLAMQWHDKNIGMEGGTRVRAGESVKELVTAKEAGFLIQNAG